jgi:photosystem II stability/assembly factor-like uncharacterized protein
VSRVPPVVAYAATSEGVFRTTEGSQTWSSAGVTNEHVYRIVVDRQRPSIAYAASYSTVFKTMDGGRNWTAVSRDLSGWDPASLTIAASAPSTLYLGAENGVFKTTDAGSTWSRGPRSISSVRALAVDPRDAANVYALANNRFALSRDGGATWSTPTSVYAGGGNVNRLLTDPTMPTTVLAYGIGVCRSCDAGATWRNVLPSCAE